MAKIEFISVSLRNFMSFGNVETTFDYKKGINIVTGKVENSNSRNGAGKSTLLVDALSFALYGKVLRGSKVVLAEVVNKINKKNCYVTVLMRVDGELIKVTRSIKPSDLQIFVGDNLVLKKFSANGLNQQWLEKKIGINHVCFNNIIVLNINSSIPFLNMDAQAKRDVIENVLMTGVYGKMAKKAGENYLDLKTKLKTCETSFNMVLKHLESSKNILAKHQEVIDKQKKEKEEAIKEIKDEIKVLQDVKGNLLLKDIDEIALTASIKANGEKVKKLSLQINEMSTKVKITQNNISTAAEALAQIENVPHCPTCHTPSDNPFINIYKNDLREKIEHQEHLIVGYKKKGNDLLQEKNTCELNIEKANEEIENHRSAKSDISELEIQISSKERELERETNRKIEQGGISEEAVKELEVKFKEEQEKLDNVSSEFKHYSAIRQILGEEGLRKFSVSRILPILNSKVNEYLKIFGSEYTLIFNMNLDERILSRNREERPYASFSSGEKKRIDLSILHALMDISRMQNSVETNILILDEVLDTSMDSDGVESFLEFLKTGFKKAYPDKCIYIITHRKEISGETFDRLISLVKRKNFTEIDSIVEMAR